MIVERKPILTNLDNYLQIVKTDKLAKITEMILKIWMNPIIVITLKMENQATPYLRIMCLVLEILQVTNPHNPQYKKLKNKEITSLTLRITDQDGNIITSRLQTASEVLCEC